MSFEKIPLGEAILSANTGADAIKRAPIVDYETPFRCLRIGDISNRREFEKWGFTSADEKIQKNFGLKKGDVFIARTGNTIGVSTIIEEDINAVFNNGLIRLKVKDEFEPLFIYYLVSSEAFKAFIGQISGGTSTQPNVKIQHVLQFPIPNISQENQKRLAHILKVLDFKIDNNQALLRNLEEISQAVFKRWFIDFEFPNEEGLPYKSGGGKMVESELGGIPEGWNVRELKEIVQMHKKNFNPQKSAETIVKHFSLPAFDANCFPVTDEVRTIKSNKWIVEENCVLFSKMNPSTPRIWLPPLDDTKLNVCSSEFVVLKSNSFKEAALVYNICKSEQFIEYLVANATGSTNSRQRITPDNAMKYKIAISDNVAIKYSDVVESMMEKVVVLLKENNELQQLRDTLLPKLLSGEIEIPDESVAGYYV